MSKAKLAPPRVQGQTPSPTQFKSKIAEDIRKQAENLQQQHKPPYQPVSPKIYGSPAKERPESISVE